MTTLDPAEYDYFDGRFRGEDERVVIAEMRATCPVVFSEAQHQWELFTYRECREIYENWEGFSNVVYPADKQYGADAAPKAGVLSTIPENVDPPEHRDYRLLMNPVFSLPEMRGLEDSLRSYAVELLDSLQGQSRFDVIEQFALPFPTKSFCRLMGWPLEDYPQLMAWRDVYMNFANPFVADRLGIAVEDRDETGRPKPAVIRPMIAAVERDLIAYLGAHYDERLANPTADVMSQLTHATYGQGDEARPVTKDEVIRMTFVLYLGGLDTVGNTLGYAFHEFARDPSARRRFIELMDDEERIAPAIEEIVRFTAVTRMSRRVTQDCEVLGRQLQAGDLIALDTLGSSHDPSVFDNPEELRFDRFPNAHLGFGLGRHRCLGIHLARLELKVALQEWHRRLPDYAFDPESPVERGPSVVRGITRLPLVVPLGAESEAFGDATQAVAPGGVQ